VEEPEYAHRLGAIELPPHVLFVLGDLRALDPGSAVAVVGTRHPTFAGQRVAARIAAALAVVGATVVSGLALGIDGEAHRATLEQGGSTVAVIGSGHARLFPREHTHLAQRIAANGGAVVSDSPRTSPRRRARSRVGTGSSAACRTQRSLSRPRPAAAP